MVGEVPVSGEIPDLSAQCRGFMAAADAAAGGVPRARRRRRRAPIAAQLKASSLAALPRVATAQILTGANARSRHRTRRHRIPRAALAARPGRRPARCRRAGEIAAGRARRRPAPVRLRRRRLEAGRVFRAPVQRSCATRSRGATGELQIAIDGAGAAHAGLGRVQRRPRPAAPACAAARLPRDGAAAALNGSAEPGDRAPKTPRSRTCAAPGLQLLARNVRYPFGEIDLVMRDGATLAFVEVRFRRSHGFGGAAASVDAAKRRKLARAAQAWLGAHRAHARAPLPLRRGGGDAVRHARRGDLHSASGCAPPSPSTTCGERGRPPLLAALRALLGDGGAAARSGRVPGLRLRQLAPAGACRWRWRCRPTRAQVQAIVRACRAHARAADRARPRHQHHRRQRAGRRRRGGVASSA